MKYIKLYENSNRIKSKKIFYFEDPNTKEIIEETVSNLRDLFDNYKIDLGFVKKDWDNEYSFDWDQYVDLKDCDRTAGVLVYECYRVRCYSDGGYSKNNITHDGDEFSSDIDFLTKVLPELKDAISKLNNLNGLSVAYRLSDKSVDLLVHVKY
jgi:hypothetical protein